MANYTHIVNSNDITKNPKNNIVIWVEKNNDNKLIWKGREFLENDNTDLSFVVENNKFNSITDIINDKEFEKKVIDLTSGKFDNPINNSDEAITNFILTKVDNGSKWVSDDKYVSCDLTPGLLLWRGDEVKYKNYETALTKSLSMVLIDKDKLEFKIPNLKIDISNVINLNSHISKSVTSDEDGLKIWRGTKAQYTSVTNGEPDPKTLYFIVNEDGELDSTNILISDVEGLTNKLNDIDLTLSTKENIFNEGHKLSVSLLSGTEPDILAFRNLIGADSGLSEKIEKNKTDIADLSGKVSSNQTSISDIAAKLTGGNVVTSKQKGLKLWKGTQSEYISDLNGEAPDPHTMYFITGTPDSSEETLKPISDGNPVGTIISYINKNASVGSKRRHC